MSHRTIVIASLLTLLLLPLAHAQDSKPARKRTIAVIPKGTTHVFWKSVEAGAKKAAEEAGVEIIWKGPLKENDRAQQIQVVQQFIAQGVSGIVLAPLDHKALVPAARSASDKKIPLVVFDSALEGAPGKDFASFVATDNQKGGELGGRELAKIAGAKGGVALLRYIAGSSSTDERERGFLSAIKAEKQMTIVSDNRYGGATVGDAKTQALNMMDDIRNADGGVFCPNESSTLGMLLALRQEGLAGKINFVGFDASPPLVEALRSGEIHALVVQNPRKMGYLAVQTLVKVMDGKPTDPIVDTGVAVVTKANLDTPEIKALLE